MMKKKIKWKNVIVVIICFVCLIGLIVSSVDIIKWKIDAKRTSEQTKIIQNFVDIIEIDNSDKTEIILPKGDVDLGNPYWEYIDMNQSRSNMYHPFRYCKTNPQYIFLYFLQLHSNQNLQKATSDFQAMYIR